VLISVVKNGEVFLGTTKTPPDALPSKVKDLLTSKVAKTVYVQADMRARYERVTEVVDNLRGAGVDNVGLITEQDGASKKKEAQP
jgi:biopolymer transport protein ExbD